jgi:hypothetical protein
LVDHLSCLPPLELLYLLSSMPPPPSDCRMTQSCSACWIRRGTTRVALRRRIPATRPTWEA